MPGYVLACALGILPGMQVVFLSPAHPFRGGIAQFTQMWARAMISAGHAVNILTFTRQFPGFLFPGKSQMDPSAPPADLEIERTFCAWDPVSWGRTAARIRQLAPDVLVVAWWIPYFGPGYSAVMRMVRRWLPRTRVLVSVHNAVPHENWPLARAFTLATMRSAHQLVTHSSTVAGDLAAMGLPRARIQVGDHPTYAQYQAPRGTRQELRQRLGIKESRVLLFFGYIKKYKGLATLVAAMPGLVRCFDGDLRLLVVGDFYYDRAEHHTQARELGVERNITLVDDYVPDDRVGDYFGAADLLVLPYDSATQSGVLQIANHFALPAVASAVGGLPDMIRHGETGFLAAPDSPEDLARQIEAYFETRDEVDFPGNIRQGAAIIGWEGLVQLLETLR